MRTVSFRAYGHENVAGTHKTTLELTSETFLTPTGTCIVGVKSDLTLNRLDEDIKSLARSENTEIRLTLLVNGLREEIVGWGSQGLTYTDETSIVIRTSSFECPRTLMINADKAAADISRDLIEELQNPKISLDCRLTFVTL